MGFHMIMIFKFLEEILKKDDKLKKIHIYYQIALKKKCTKFYSQQQYMKNVPSPKPYQHLKIFLFDN